MPRLEFSPLLSADDRLEALNKRYPGVMTIVKHSRANIREGKQIITGDVVESVRTITVESDGREFLIPTVYDGQRVSADEALKRAQASMRKGAVFPTAPAGRFKELDALSKQISQNLSNSEILDKRQKAQSTDSSQ